MKQTTTTKPFIANRVAEITQSLPAFAWTYVLTDENPADLLTRRDFYQAIEVLPTLDS